MDADLEQLTNVTYRIEPAVAKAFLEYCEKSNDRKYQVLAEAVQNFAMLRENPHLLDSRQKHFLFLRRPKTRGKKIVVGTRISPATKMTLDLIKGQHSPAQVVNEALRIYFQQQERESAAAYDPLKMTRFCGPLYIDLDDVDTSELFPGLPNNLSLARDQSLIPGRVKGSPILVDSSYLLGMMLGSARTMIGSAEGHARADTFLKPLFEGSLVLSTTTAQVAEFSETAASLFSLNTWYDFPKLLESRRAPPVSSLMANRLKERLQLLQSCGVSIIPVEPSDYVRGCDTARSVWPVSMAKLVGLAALTRITRNDRISVLSLYRTKAVSPLQVWEHFTDGYCGEISSSDSRYPSYLPPEMVQSSEDDFDAPPVRSKKLPYIPKLHPVFQR